MIKAKPSKAWKKIIGAYFEKKLKKAFFKTHIRGLGITRFLKENSGKNIPVIFYCSHTSWWDAAVTIVLALRVLKVESYGMMEEKQLEKFRFFTRIGMFSVVREDARSALKSLDYAADLLKNSHRSLWIFPQGKIEHQEKKNIDFENGLSILLKKTGEAYFVPVAIRYDFLKEERPECFISIGEPEFLKAGKAALKLQTQHFLKTLTLEIENLRDDVIQQRFKKFDVLLHGSQSVEKRWDRFKSTFDFKNKKGD